MKSKMQRIAIWGQREMQALVALWMVGSSSMPSSHCILSKSRSQPFQTLHPSESQCKASSRLGYHHRVPQARQRPELQPVQIKGPDSLSDERRRWAQPISCLREEVGRCRELHLSISPRQQPLCLVRIKRCCGGRCDNKRGTRYHIVLFSAFLVSCARGENICTYNSQIQQHHFVLRKTKFCKP